MSRERLGPKREPTILVINALLFDKVQHAILYQSPYIFLELHLPPCGEASPRAVHVAQAITFHIMWILILSDCSLALLALPRWRRATSSTIPKQYGPENTHIDAILYLAGLSVQGVPLASRKFLNATVLLPHTHLSHGGDHERGDALLFGAYGDLGRDARLGRVRHPHVGHHPSTVDRLAQ